MKAIVQTEYGSADALHVAEVEEPVIKPEEVLVRVAAASVHAGDALMMQGKPYLFRTGTGVTRPKNPVPGFDLAGTIVSVGSKVTDFAPGDEVFGNGRGTLAEFAPAKQSYVTSRPPAMSVDDAAVTGVSGLTALEAVRGIAKVTPGQRVLVNGAAGGIGTFAVQIAKASGAEVTGVCGPSKADLVRTIGADHVVDYTTEDFTKTDTRYDFILDNVGNRSLSDCRKVLADDGVLIPNSGTAGGSWVGPLFRMAHALVVSPFTSQHMRVFVSIPTREALDQLAELVVSGAVTPVIGGRFSLDEAPKALDAIASGHATGKMLIEVAA